MTDSPPANQTGFLHEPRTEQEVVCLFGALLDDLDFPCVVDTMQTAFPDCILRRTDTGETLRIEFELYSSHFRLHGHPIDECDGIVCWRDDWGTWPPGFLVIELADVVASKRPEILVSATEREPQSPWSKEAFLQQATQDGVSARDLELTEAILEVASERGLGPHWLAGARGGFVVGDDRQFFKVWSNGRLAFPFARLGADERFDELARRLNETLSNLEIAPADASSKGLSGQLSELFETREQLVEFFEVWVWFADLR